MVPVIGSYWTPGSATAAMLRSIQGHRDLQDKNRNQVVNRVSTRRFDRKR